MSMDMETIEIPEVPLENITGDISAQLDPKTKTQLQNLKALSVSYYSKVRECMKPWSEFANVRSMSKPSTAGEAGHRVYVNVFKYQGNYLCLVFLLFVYSVATNPYLLLGIGLGCFTHLYFATKRNSHDGSVKVAGRQLSLGQQYGVLCGITIPLLFLGSAGSVLFWLIGASVVLVLIHASFVAVESSRVFEEPV
ncbi:prenylated Rab acceptor protein 1-like isoform X2 [Symsagittifera roscoffensis]|uniref:prenylated Rab acceptor protein 1-like isoform X2 n=1 Tax=Symsagittifera roscoffensis TaxID=84072 RepID=UPI00307B8E6B